MHVLARAHTHVYVYAEAITALIQIPWLSLEAWPNETKGMVWQSKWGVLVKPTHQFFSGGNRPLHLVLLAMCICRMEKFHSGVESFDPMMCGGQPYRKRTGFTICTGVFTAWWSAIISRTWYTLVLAVFTFHVDKPQPHVTKLTLAACYRMMQESQECPVCLVTRSHRKVCFTKREILPEPKFWSSETIVYVFFKSQASEKVIIWILFSQQCRTAKVKVFKQIKGLHLKKTC